MKQILMFLLMIGLLHTHQPASGQEWQKLNTTTFRGKQDDIHSTDTMRGWYVNGSGKIYGTTDGGNRWELLFEKPGTFFRCVAFLDSMTGFAGNIGTEYFPNVTDTTPLYKTSDGGRNWQPVAYSGPRIKGLCAIELVKVGYVNHGVLSYRHRIVAGGRVGNPAFLLISDDNGNTFRSQDMNNICAFILDIKFVNERDGYIAAGSNKDIARSHALILRTTDGGRTWRRAYKSKRYYEITWKIAFPNEKTGYATLQSYNPDSNVRERFVLKTTNKGRRWKEKHFVNDPTVREFGIGFIDSKHGWIGTNNSGYETTNGGSTWTAKEFGKAVNKIRVIRTSWGYVCYAIGNSVWKWVRAG